MASLDQDLRFVPGFAVVENPGLWNSTFTLKGINGEVLAEIDRDWRAGLVADWACYGLVDGFSAANKLASK
ncbi:hypothetical protein SSX86_011993 [Deinandra increscens subsp. villosa]|uniref:Uncharacterized protein n=1 Tax=Deinandra increscens subsp. villosa TaxID=3103831 RepID=A0AAP0D7V2_9ASTR